MVTRLLICIILTCAAAHCAVAAGPTQVPKTKAVTYEAWKLRFDVPRVSRKVVLPPREDIELWDLYLYGDFAYFVKIVKIPANTLTATIIEQEIQADASLFAKRGQTKRWEMDLKQGLFKGLNYYARVEEDIPEAAVELAKVLRGRTASVGSAWTQLGDDYSSVLVVGVVGPKGRDAEIDSVAKFLVNGLVKLKPGEQPKVASKEPGPTRPPTSVVRPPTSDLRPPTSKPRPLVKPRPALKKGDIEIVGQVESVAANRKSVIILAERITLAGMSPVTLDPKRSKTVRIDKLPPGVMVGAGIVVIGKNKGVGTPITAAWLEVAPSQP